MTRTIQEIIFFKIEPVSRTTDFPARITWPSSETYTMFLLPKYWQFSLIPNERIHSHCSRMSSTISGSKRGHWHQLRPPKKAPTLSCTLFQVQNRVFWALCPFGGAHRKFLSALCRLLCPFLSLHHQFSGHSLAPLMAIGSPRGSQPWASRTQRYHCVGLLYLGPASLGHSQHPGQQALEGGNVQIKGSSGWPQWLGLQASLSHRLSVISRSATCMAVRLAGVKVTVDMKVQGKVKRSRD